MNSPYLLIPIILITLAGYLMSYLLYKVNLLSKTLHRKIWNTLLLTTALVTLLLGLILTVEVNYKLEWPWVKQMLKWHVDFGIAMTLIAGIHVTWHWSYYSKLFGKTGKPVQEENLQESDSAKLFPRLNLLMVLLGVVSITTQILLMREITTVFQGNELLMAWTLGVWMLLTGIGAYLTRNPGKQNFSHHSLVWLFLVLAGLPVLLDILLNLLKNSLFLPGILISPLWFLVILLVVLSPFCLLSGIAFSGLVHLHLQKDGKGVVVYIWESVGSLLGGVLVSYLLIQWLSVVQSLLLILILTLLVFLVLFPRMSYLVAVLSLGFIWAMTFVFPVNNWLKSALFVNQKVIASKETRHGNITVTENGGQFNFFENGSLLFSSDNLISSEEHVHYAMMQHPDARKVLLISGGISGILRELLKYPAIERIDYVELDPWLIRLADTISPFPKSPKIHLVVDDGRRFIVHSKEKYDVAIFALPDPSSLQLNRFYTSDFMWQLKKKLNPGAVVLFSLTPAGNYLSDVKTGMEASVYNALKKNFNTVQIIPGEKDYLVAGDRAIQINMAELSSQVGIETQYVNSYFLNDRSIEQRSQFIINDLSRFKEVDTDQQPLPVFYHTLEILAQFGGQNLWMLLLPLLLFLWPLFFMKPVTAGIFMTGFSGSSIEMMVLFTFQTLFGNVYSAIGLLIAVFMGGLTAGAVLGKNLKFTLLKFRIVQLLVILYVLTFPLLWKVQNSIDHQSVLFITFILAVFIISAFVGLQFALGTSMSSNQSVTSVSYSADLLGSALGVVIVTILLVPLLGIVYSCLLIAGLNALILIVGLFKRV